MEVPDYFDIVKRPMCWSTIDSKLDRHEYWDLQSFKVGAFFVSVLTLALTAYIVG